MKQAPQHIIDLSFVARPIDGGNPHQPKWAHDGERIIRRTFNWDSFHGERGRITNTRQEYHAFKQGKRGEFDPINGQVNAIGKGKFLGVS